ncbi:Crp/Fnr family transcriptional regulator [Lyngbya confervoides]|uniref:Crp/Fnr family transcriptional regulator n=1 Tax=Lyngbya confervoides BDU141951 TaxID=1574623 RepID=A0ABD4T7S2_9CYAN|nr:Crp/Fnr family transcriptional regulator [Lyngbya confervoides]MCM1984499.1 Crp/Fnr family transcriptional regulator [Lyngbya confervoides BDU141951]
MFHDPDLGRWLQSTLLFRNLSTSQCSSLLRISHPQTFQKGDLIFRQGHDALGFYIVQTGRVKIFKVSSTGREQILNIFGPGENFAEVAALDGKPFPASAATLESTTMIFFPRQAFLQLLRECPEIAINMLTSLSQHTRHLTGVIEELSFKDVSQRLASYLLKQSADGCVQASDSLRSVIRLELTKSQLAATLGTIPATLSRAFYRLSQEGLIEVKGAEVLVRDRHRLQRWGQPLDGEEIRTE